MIGMSEGYNQRQEPDQTRHSVPSTQRFTLPNACTLAVLILLGACFAGAFMDLDFTWQIRTGEKIVRTGQLRTPDSFTYTIPGRQVPDFEWLYEVILWAVWTGFGFGGLRLMRVLLVGTTLVLLTLRLRREGVRTHGIALALLTAAFTLSPGWNVRPLYCTSISLLLVSGWLHDHCKGRRPLSWWLPVVMLLWGNMHPGVIVGQGLLAGTIAWEWLNRWVRLNTPLSTAACRRLTLIGGLGLAATLVSPDPLDRLLYPFRPEVTHSVQRIFVEMQPLYAFADNLPAVVALAFAVMVLVLVTVALRFRHFRLWEVALLTGLAGLANLAVRSLQDCILVMLALGVPQMAALLRQAARSGRRRPWLVPLLRADRSFKKLINGPLFRFQLFWPAAALGLLLVVGLTPMSRRMPLQEGPEWPVAALDRIEALGLHGHFFAPPDFGAYVTWRLGDRARSYVDTRGFFFPGELLEDSHYLPLMAPDWRTRLDRVLDDYPTDYFLLETSGGRARLWQALEPHAGEPLYLDRKAVLLTAAQVRHAARQLDARQSRR
jgi:hypothetical protein